MNRRKTEADAAGISAARARQVMLAAMDSGDDKMTKAAAYAYGVLVEKAQFLSHLSLGIEDDGLDDFLSAGVPAPVRDPEETGAGDAGPGSGGGVAPPR